MAATLTTRSTLQGSEYSASAARPDDNRSMTVRSLRERMRNIESTGLPIVTLPTHPLLAQVLPGGALRAGSTYAVTGSVSLALAMLAGPSSTGAWTAAVGAPDLGIEAAAALGIDLERFALVPHPGGRWLAVVSALIDTIPIVLLAAPVGVGETIASKLSARLRQREAVLVTLGSWPHAEFRLNAVGEGWHGIERGHGHLVRGRVEVDAFDRAGRRMLHTIELSGHGALEVAS